MARTKIKAGQISLATSGGLAASSADGGLYATTVGSVSGGGGVTAFLTPGTNTPASVAVSANLLTNGGLDVSSDQLYVRSPQLVGSDPGSPSAGDVWYNTATGRFRGRAGSLATGTIPLTAQVVAADGAVIDNTTTETFFDTTHELVIPAGSLLAGRAIRCLMAGRFQNNSGTTTHQLQVYANTTSGGNLLILQSGAMSVSSSASLNRAWVMDFSLLFPTIGASGTVSGFGTATSQNNQTSGMSAGSQTINTTQAITIRVSLLMSVAAANNRGRIQNSQFSITN